jgi:hypothetical protein
METAIAGVGDSAIQVGLIDSFPKNCSDLGGSCSFCLSCTRSLGFILRGLGLPIPQGSDPQHSALVNSGRLPDTDRDLTDRSSGFFINPVMGYVDRRALLMTEKRCKRTELRPTPDHPCEFSGLLSCVLLCALQVLLQPGHGASKFLALMLALDEPVTLLRENTASTVRPSPLRMSTTC